MWALYFTLIGFLCELVYVMFVLKCYFAGRCSYVVDHRPRIPQWEAEGVVQSMVECVPSMHKALVSIASTTKKMYNILFWDEIHRLSNGSQDLLNFLVLFLVPMLACASLGWALGHTTQCFPLCGSQSEGFGNPHRTAGLMTSGRHASPASCIHGSQP